GRDRRGGWREAVGLDEMTQTPARELGKRERNALRSAPLADVAERVRAFVAETSGVERAADPDRVEDDQNRSIESQVHDRRPPNHPVLRFRSRWVLGCKSNAVVRRPAWLGPSVESALSCGCGSPNCGVRSSSADGRVDEHGRTERLRRERSAESGPGGAGAQK